MLFHRCDDSNAFDAKFIEIHLENATGLNISKAELSCGKVVKTFENPVFPLLVDFNCDESAKLCDINRLYLAVYDEQGRKRTCEGCCTFETKKKVV